MAIPKGPGMGVRQRIANAANLGRNIARKPIGDPTGQGLKGKTLTGGAMQIKRNVGTKVPETRKKGGMVKSSAQTSVIKGAQAPGSREGSVIKGPKAKGSREGSVIKAKTGGWIQKAIKKPGALRASLGVKKGKDSIVYGINLINQNKIYITKRSKNLIDELKNYVWAKDKEGVVINKPVDAFNHCIDAARYALISELENPFKNKYFVY